MTPYVFYLQDGPTTKPEFVLELCPPIGDAKSFAAKLLADRPGMITLRSCLRMIRWPRSFELNQPPIGSADLELEHQYAQRVSGVRRLIVYRI